MQEIKLFIRTKKGETAQGKKYNFNEYFTFGKDGEFIQVKFNKTVLPPQEEGIMTLDFDAQDPVTGYYINNRKVERESYIAKDGSQQVAVHNILWIGKYESFEAAEVRTAPDHNPAADMFR